MFGGDTKSNNSPRMYKLTHQLLSIVGFNFEKESIAGYVHMNFLPLTPDLKTVYINCQQCSIHRVAVNDIEPVFSYSDPTLDICQGQEKERHKIESFEACHRNMINEVNPDNGKGEICILIPDEMKESIMDMRPFKVIVEFSLVNPKGGLKFVVPDIDGTLLERGAHLFTYGHENSSRLWFPCIDSYSEVCTWKLEFTVSMYMFAVSCGDLCETIYSSDLRQKIFHYYLSVPTAAPNIALAVGPFEVWVDPNMHEVTNFCLPGVLPVLKHTTSFIHTVFEFYEELLATRYPYSCYKQVFVDTAYQDVMPYATMSICSVNLLHSKKIIEQTMITQCLLSKAIAQQFFGCYISMNSWSDAWLTKGLASLLSSLFYVRTFGHTSHTFSTAVDMRRVCEYELNTKPVVLDPSKTSVQSLESPHFLSPSYLEMYNLKSGLVMRLLEKVIGREFMRQVMNKLLVLALNAAQQKYGHANTWSNMVISTASFIKCIMLTTGKDVSTYINQWVYHGGAVVFIGSFNFNKKRNVLELELKQDRSLKNYLPYFGPINVVVQELDGSFSRQFLIKENQTKFDIACHSKSRRQKKKKIPLWTNEEVEINLDEMDSESPVLWVRVDPDMCLLRIVRLEQADYMWRHMLLHERCVVAQLDAVRALESFPTDDTKKCLSHAVENERFYFKIREAAAFCLVKVENRMNRVSVLNEIFKKMFGSPSCTFIVRRNNFSSIQHYLLQKSLPLAISQMRNMHNICPSDTLKFLLNLFKYNDNTNNKYSDCYYKACLVDALANTVTQSMTPVSVRWNEPSSDLLTNDIKEIVEEIVRCLNMEKLFYCYKFAVTASCLRALRRLQAFGHLPNNTDLFKSYAREGNFIDVRLAAVEALVDCAATSDSPDILAWLLDLVENDADPYLRFKIVQMLIENPPFQILENPTSAEKFRDQLWNMMNSGLSHDCRLRCVVVDLYRVISSKPTRLNKENAKESKSLLSGPLDGGNSRDGSEVTLKRKADSPPEIEQNTSALKMELWGGNSPEYSANSRTYHSEGNSLDVKPDADEKKDSQSSLSKANRMWSDIYHSAPMSFQGFGNEKKIGKDKDPIPRAELEITIENEMNLSELSDSSSSRESSPKRRVQDSRATGTSYYGGSHTMKPVSSFLSDDDDEDEFENFGSNNMKSGAGENSYFNRRADDDDDEDEYDNTAMNLSSDSEAGRSRPSSPGGDNDEPM